MRLEDSDAVIALRVRHVRSGDLETGATTVPDGQGGTLNLGGESGHSEYPTFMDNGTPRTTDYNIAAIIAGLDENAIRQK